jgi:hypothetical protein
MARVFAVLTFLFAAASLAAPPVQADGGKVVVELFTSQGCSSCPPADEYLAELAKRDDVIALSFHVDYWNYIGWSDPFSSREATERQRAYGRTMGKSYVYTPQIVVDGRAETVGSNRHEVANLISMAGAAPKIPISVDHPPDGTAVLRLPETRGVAADIWVGFYDDRHRTDVLRGENRGRTIANANVVRSIRRVMRWSGEKAEHPVDLKALGAAGRNGCVVIVQTARNGPVLAAVAFALPSH